MNVLFPLLFLALILVLAAGIFLWPARRSRLQVKKKEFDALPRPLFMQETAEEPGLHIPASTARPVFSPPPEPQLPRKYGVDRLVLMARDPHWLYAYWEITATKQEEFINSYGPAAWSATHPVLRVYDVTGVDFDGKNANSYMDIPVGEDTENWYIEVGQPDRSFCVDLGRMFPDGRFVTLLRSNTVTTPRASLSDRLDEEWMWIEGLYRTISRLQYGTSSPLIVEELAVRAGALPLGISSPGNWENRRET
ncbi:MAG: DUF4912 domain-containing protein [Pelotomaculum sp.]|uniref:Uncharacterized protein conserved in bacteria n=1 Tax=Pelotomaculum thermopropionicum (strain DSM 13744 / JCM 10971 / SI) TaxID=370438 RepID=A5D024_PELTS|nr:DUF4912 domain-containing protein [Pelotomaculum sp.]BAF60408.1 Uncharacterized protein conserved in bacteria [Pelotomaculum thermopropionicum SI]